MAAAKEPGGNVGKGRPKGVPNKFNATLKDMILGALVKAGGQEYLAKQAEENPGPFMVLLGKVLPTTLGSDPNDPLIIEAVHFAGAARASDG